MGSQGGMNNLTTLIKRLEAATSRLEDIASSSQSADGLEVVPGTSAAAVNRSAGAVQSHPSSIPPSSVAAPAAPAALPHQTLPRSVEEFDSIVQDDLQPFATLSDKLGDAVKDQGVAFCNAFKAQRDVLLVASKAKKPNQSTPIYLEILKGLQEGMQQVDSIKEKNRKCPQENHLSMVADGVGILAWVTMEAKPDRYVQDVLDGSQMYGNRILTAFKEKDPQQVEWMRAFVKLGGSLKSYVHQNHPMGLTWNPNGVSAEEALAEVKSTPKTNGVSSAALTPRAGGGPPPPPPLPPAFDIGETSATVSSPAAGDMGSVFSELNRGESVTSGLRKVDKSQMTHKNPSLRAQAPVRSDSNSSKDSTRGKSPAPNKKPVNMRTKKPSRKELDGNKWLIENFENEQNAPIEIAAEKQHAVLITRCINTTIRVTGKANAISIDSCSRLAIIFDSLVSSVEVTNTQNLQLQVLDTLPSIQLDKVDGATLYLSRESLGVEVLTSKCSAVNITLPPSSETDDGIECPVPEQFKTCIRNGQLFSEIVKQEG